MLLDVMMPVMDGWQVLRTLKTDEVTRDIPVVMLTALSEERDTRKRIARKLEVEPGQVADEARRLGL